MLDASHASASDQRDNAIGADGIARRGLGKTKLEKELDGLSLAPDQKPLNPDDVVLRGIPNGMGDRVEQTLLEITPDGLIARIVVEERDGSVTEFRFLQQKENVEIPDGQFRFIPPPGTEVVAGTEFTE